MSPGPEPSLLPLALLAATAVVWYAVNRALFADLLSPFSLVFLSWVLPLFLQAMNLSHFETAWTLGPTLIVAWTTCALVGTCLLAAAFTRSGPPAAEQRASFATTLATLRNPAFITAFFACYVVTFATYIYAEFITNPMGVPLLSILAGRFPAGGAIHRWGKDTPLSAITALLFVLTPVAYLAYRANRGRSLRAALLVAALLFPMFGVLKLSRSDVFIGAIELIAVAILYRTFAGERGTGRRVSYMKLAGLAAVGLVVYYIMMAIRISSLPIEDLYAHAIGFRVPGDGPLRGLFAAIYGYLAMPFENLQRFLLAHDGGSNPGISVLRPFLSISGLGDFADRIDGNVYYPAPATFAAGSATFLTAVYAELGVIGVALIPIAYALLVNTLYVRMRARPSFANLFLYVNFIYPWMWLFFNNAFGVLSIYLNAGFIVAAALLASELRLGRARFTVAPAR